MYKVLVELRADNEVRGSLRSSCVVVAEIDMMKDVVDLLIRSGDFATGARLK